VALVLIVIYIHVCMLHTYIIVSVYQKFQITGIFLFIITASLHHESAVEEMNPPRKILLNKGINKNM